MHKHGANDLYTVSNCCAAGKLRVHAAHSTAARFHGHSGLCWLCIQKVSAEICCGRFLEREGGSADSVTSLSSRCLCRLSSETLSEVAS